MVKLGVRDLRIETKKRREGEKGFEGFLKEREKLNFATKIFR